MSVKQNLQNKIAKARTTSPLNQTMTNTVKVSNMWNWLTRTTKQNFKGEVINLADTLREKVQMLMFGKSTIINNEEFKDTDKLVSKSKLQELLFAGMGTMFDYGVARFVIEPTGKGKVPNIRLADPNFPNVVHKIGRIPYKAVVWTPFAFGRATYWKETIYTEKFIINNIYTSNGEGEDFDNKKKVSIKEFNKEIKSKSLQIQGKVKNKWGIIPVVEMTYLPTRDLSTMSMKALAPKNRLIEPQKMLNEGTGALRLELYLNRTKMLVDKDLLDTASQDQIQKIAQENIIGVVSDSGDHEGSNKMVEIMQGDPKVQQYWENISNVISLAVSILKLSELSETDSSSTATGEIFNKGNDVETSNAIGTFLQIRIAELLEKAKIIMTMETSSESELETNDWAIQIVPNVIMNESKMTEMISSQLSMGIINMVQAKVKLENISKEDAIASLKEEEEFHNPNLLAVSSFGEDEDKEDNEDQTSTKGNDMTSSGNNKPKPSKK